EGFWRFVARATGRSLYLLQKAGKSGFVKGFRYDARVARWREEESLGPRRVAHRFIDRGSAARYYAALPLEEESLKLGDISGVSQQFTRLQALASKLNMSDSSQWLALLEEIMESAVEQDVEHVVEALPLIKTWPSAELAAAETGLRRGFLQLVA